METTFVEHFHVENVHNVSVVGSRDLRYFKPFDVQMSYGTDSLFLCCARWLHHIDCKQQV